MTDEQLVLCQEDISGAAPQFSHPLFHNISDVASVELDPNAPLVFSILFEKEGDSRDNLAAAEPAGHSEPWSLVVQSSTEKERFLKSLRTAWRHLFKLELSIAQKGTARTL